MPPVRTAIGRRYGDPLLESALITRARARDCRRVSPVPVACVKRVNGEVNDGEAVLINDPTMAVECAELRFRDAKNALLEEASASRSASIRLITISPLRILGINRRN